MLSWLKRHFIPHEGNEHRPYILRGTNVHRIITAIIFLELILFLLPVLNHVNRFGNMASVLPSVLADLTNSERHSDNLKPLVINPVLNKAAEMKARDMATKGYFAHTSPEGKTPWYWLSQVGYNYQYAGENLAINFTDSKDVTAAWMKSPTHKANIIKENYTEIGTGIASGMYEGKEAIYVAQVYANPLIIRPESKNLATVTPTIIKEPKKDLAIKEATGTHSSNTKATPDNIVAQTEEPTNVLGAETKKIDPKIIISEDTNIKPLPKPTIIQKLAASPRHTANTILYIIFGIMAISLTLNIFIKIKHHHTDLITNGLITLAIIGAVLLGNYYLSKSTTVVVQSLDYSNESK